MIREMIKSAKGVLKGRKNMYNYTVNECLYVAGAA
jgi:hypothetical protein